MEKKETLEERVKALESKMFALWKFWLLTTLATIGFAAFVLWKFGYM